MELITKLYNIANSTMEEPASFGGFHLAFVASVILLTVLMASACRNCSDKTLRGVTGFVWIIIALLEVYKQIIFGLSLSDGVFSWDYAWYAFPFQFCSSPLYILPIIAFAKNEKLRERCIAYMMTFSLFAGLAVFCYPNDVFIETVGINYQTMIHHGSQILMGVLYGVRYRAKLSPKFFFGGVRTFVAMVFIAMLLNVAGYHMLTLAGMGDTFNMFYISPYFACTLPILDTVWVKLPYLAFVCVYFFGFILCALIVFSFFVGFTKSSRPYVATRKGRKLAYENDCIFYYNM